MSGPNTLQAKITPYIRKRIDEAKQKLYMTGRAESDTDSEFVRDAVLERLDRIEADASGDRQGRS